MNKREMKAPIEIEIPDLKVNGITKKILDFFNKIRHIYLLIVFLLFFILLVKFTPKHIWIDFYYALLAQHNLLILIFIFSIVALSFIWSFGQKVDVAVFKYFNMSGERPAWLDWVMLAVTQLGNFVFALGVALILYLQGNHFLAYELILGILSLGVAVEFIKTLVRRTRPYIAIKNIRIVGVRERGRSFPSGHTSQAFFMATLFMHFYKVNPSLWFLVYFIALLVGITRIYVGMHYPRDVIGGAVFGSSWALLGVIVNNFKF